MKQLILFALMFVAAVIGVIWVTSYALSRASERTVVYQYIADALDALSERPNHVNWEPAVVALDRAFTDGDEDLIGLAMTEAWYALALAQSTGEAEILFDAFSGVAQERAVRSIADAAHGGRMVVLAQDAKPLFYHLDGSVFQAEVSMLAARYMIQDDELIYYEMVEDQAVTTLLNESNGWRVFAHERFGAIPLELRAPGWNGANLAGINYYPAQTPWRDFWPKFDEAIVAKDFETIASLNANAIRIFLSTDPFLAKDSRDDALTDLATLLKLAEEAGLRVVPTLFDLKPTFDSSGWGQDYAYLQNVLPILANSSAVAYIDIKNEPDLDFDAHGRGHMLAWLSTMIHLVRKEAPELALTIGWSKSDLALEMADLLDVVTYHEYQDVETADSRLDAIFAETDRQVMVTEIGVSSYEIGLGLPGSLRTQQETLEDHLSALGDANGLFVWTLYDFPKVDASAIGGSPWVQRLQSNFGLFDANGNEKPSASTIRTVFGGMTQLEPSL